MDRMPEGLPRAVQEVLQHWYKQEPHGSPWSEMLVVVERLAAEPSTSVGQIVKQILLETLDTLDKKVGADPAQLIRWRYFDNYTAYAVANRLNASDSVVFKAQRAAIKSLSSLLWQAETSAREARVERVHQRMAGPAPLLLFGVTDKLNELSDLLTAPRPPWLLAIVGIGGIGKTSLAESAVRALCVSPVFTDIVWVSARQERFTTWGGLEEAKDIPALTTDRLLDAIIEQLALQDLAPRSVIEKQTWIRSLLRARPYLIVVDNLETVADYHALVPDLLGLAGPTKFLLTSRYSLHDYSGVHNLPLDELSQADSLALLRQEAAERGLADVAAATDEALVEVHMVTGGNPLALKLLLGQMHSLSLAEVVESLREARGQTADDLYRYIYWRSWHLLSPESQMVLVTLPTMAAEVSGSKVEYLAALTGLKLEQVAAALRQLTTLSLVNVRGTVETRRYSLHRLTESFLLHEVAKWQVAV